MKQKPFVARVCTFSRALCRLRVITSSFDWFTEFSPSFLIGQSNYFGFGFTTLVEIALKMICACLPLDIMREGSSLPSYRAQLTLSDFNFAYTLLVYDFLLISFFFLSPSLF